MGPLFPNHLSHFSFGQTWNETKTLLILLESFCVHSPAYASFYFSLRLFLLALSLLLGIYLFSLCSPPFPLHAPALIPLSLTWTLSFLTIWCSGQTALFLFLLANAAVVYLPTALSVALRPLFPFQQAQYAQVFLLKPAPFCKLFAGLGSTEKSFTFLLFSSYLTLVLSSPPSFLLFQTLCQIWQKLSSLLLFY